MRTPAKSLAPGSTNKNHDGFVLLGVLILVALFSLFLAIAAPIMAKSIERDKEVEAVERGKQYTQAIRRYYKRFGAYPTTIQQLESTNNVRFLRKRYIDPITGKDDWRLIHVGEAKVPVMGFFGQPLQAGQTSVSTGLNGTGGNTTGGSSSGSSFGSSSGFGSRSGSGGFCSGNSFGSTSSSFGSSGSSFGSSGGGFGNSSS